jgi:phosphopantetheine--protein transferase-like protein
VAQVPGFPNARVSISHREGHAVAVAVLRGRVGIDLEKIAVRPASFSRQWFSEAERATLGGDPQRETIAWSVKEAVLKVIGKGMALSPLDIEVASITADTAEVVLRGEVAETHAALGGGALSVSWSLVESNEVLISVQMAS